MTTPNGISADGDTAIEAGWHLLRLRKVLEITGYSKSTFYSRVASQLFTPPIKIGPRCSAWPASEVRKLNIAAIRSIPEDELRVLVKELTLLRCGV